jgi:hypothetical protein
MPTAQLTITAVTVEGRVACGQGSGLDPGENAATLTDRGQQQ